MKAELTQTVSVSSGSANASGVADEEASTQAHTTLEAEVGRYAISAEVARGGLGRILRAHDTLLDRPVAVKELLSANEGLRDRFRRETGLTARLQHPAIVPVYDAGNRYNGTPYYVMKYVNNGNTLKAAVAGAHDFAGRLALLSTIIATADAIAYTHSLNIIHRDLKPSNVLVGPFGETIVIDWGLAKDLAQREEDVRTTAPYRIPAADVTSVGAIIGTPQYMAPEQARGEVVDKRADVYALGAMLYYVLGGAPPYEGRSAAEVIALVQSRPPMPLRERQSAIPAELVAIVERAMARDASHRYVDAQEFADDLKRFQTGQLVRAHQYSAWALVRRWVKRHRFPVAIATIALLSMSALGVTGLRRIKNERSSAIAGRNMLILQQAEAELAHDPTAALEWLKTYPIDGADWGRVQTIAAQAVSHGVAQLLIPGAAESMALSRDGKLLVIGGPYRSVRVWDLERGRLRQSEDMDGDVTCIRLSPDGNTVAASDKSGRITLWSLATVERHLLGRHEGTAYRLAFSADGRFLASSAVNAVYLWDVRTGAKRAFVGKWGAVTKLAFSPDGRTLVANTAFGPLVAFDVLSGLRRSLEGHRGGVNALSVSADSRHIVSGGDDHTVRLWDVGSGRGRVLGTHTDIVWDVLFSPAGSAVASAGLDQRIHVWDLDKDSERVFAGHVEGVLDLAFSANGELLASGGSDWQVRVWDVATGNSRLLQGHHGEIGFVFFAPDGNRLISGGYDDYVRVWDLRRSVPDFVGKHEDSVHHALYSPNGRLVASDSEDRTIRVWSPGKGWSRVLAGHVASINSIAFSPDSRSLVSAARDDSVRLWSIPDGESTVLDSKHQMVRHVVFSHDGSTVAAAGSDGAVQLWNSSGRPMAQLSGHRGAVYRLAASPVANIVVSGGEDGSVRSWDMSSSQGTFLGAHSRSVLSVSFSEDGRIVASSSLDGTVRAWDIMSGRTWQPFTHGSAAVEMVRVSPDGRFLVSVSDDGTARIWELNNPGGYLLQQSKAALRAAAIARSASLVAVGGDDSDIYVVDIKTGALWILSGHRRAIRTLEFSNDEKHLLSSSEDGTIREWPLDPSFAVPEERSALSVWMQKATAATLPASSRIAEKRRSRMLGSDN